MSCADCFDCRHAAIRDWPAFTANCQGCMDRALAEKKPIRQCVATSEGYLNVLDRSHPLHQRSSGYVAEHRVVLYAAIGPGPMKCELCGVGLTWETCKVDHIDNNPMNNERSNLRPTCNTCNLRRGAPPRTRWAGASRIEFEGKVMTAFEWARDPRVRIAGKAILKRKRAGMSDEQALFAPKKSHKSKAAAHPPRQIRMMQRCYDCEMAIGAAWDSFTANCARCMTRALDSIKTLPPLEPAAEKGKEAPCSD